MKLEASQESISQGEPNNGRFRTYQGVQRWGEKRRREHYANAT
jgi:hypothetical protein